MEFHNARVDLRDTHGVNRWPDSFPSDLGSFAQPMKVAEGIYKLCWPLLMMIHEPRPDRIGITWEEKGQAELLYQNLRLEFCYILRDHPSLKESLVQKIIARFEEGQIIEASRALVTGLFFPDPVVRVACADLLMRMSVPASRAMESIEELFDIEDWKDGKATGVAAKSVKKSLTRAAVRNQDRQASS
jgi:hypothetical protein